MRVVICGDRNWSDEETIENRIKKLPFNSFIVHGGCKGADKIAGRVGWEQGHFILEVPANWKEFGKSAGPIRNQHMLTPRPDLVIAFHDNLQNSKGTKDMIMRANKAGISIEVHSSEGKTNG